MRVHSRITATHGPGSKEWIERGTNGTVKAEVNTLRTFATVTVENDGSGTIELRRIRGDRLNVPSELLAKIEFHAEGTENVARVLNVECDPTFVLGTPSNFDLPTNGGQW